MGGKQKKKELEMKKITLLLTTIFVLSAATLYAQSVSANMVRIQGGTFMMGSPASELGRGSNEIQHQVTVSSFYMGKYEVTQKEYQEVMGTNPSYYKGDNLPVEQVSWYDALVFCNKLSVMEGLTPAYRISGSTDTMVWGPVPISDNVTWNAVEIVNGSNGYRLPTEAQWEYACRAGTTTAYNTGDTISDSTGWYGVLWGGNTHQVGLKPANAWGLYDMHGNVYEWCWDRLGVYPKEAQTDPVGTSQWPARVVRGGAFYSLASALRSASRYSINQAFRGSDFGLRLVRP
jgi:formylglycine-generating enzyme required for sulfatase activity